MAFEQPLESDNVEDNLLVSLIRGPIIGGLMWILGDDEEEKKRQEAELQQGLQDMMLDDEIEHPNAKPQKSLPGLVRCDLSVGMEITGGHLDQQHRHNLQGTQRASSSDHSILSNNSQSQRSVKKKMSWSENLVEYLDESIRHEPSTAGNGNSPTMSKPIKSAMTRSASMRSYPLAGGGSAAEDKEQKIRYLPNGLDRSHNGLIMPTRPMGLGVGSDPQGNGQISPQLGWGFYTNLTPPTPEMYHSRRPSSAHNERSDNSTASGASALSSGASSGGHAAAVRGPNRVFQGLKAGSNRPPIGWPSVPL